MSWYNEGMAINILNGEHTNDAGQEAIDIQIANGDLHALKEVMEAYDVTDITDIIAFAIAVMKKSAGRPIAATMVDGSTKKFIPSASVKGHGRATEEN